MLAFSTYRLMIETQCQQLGVELPDEQDLTLGYANHCAILAEIQGAPDGAITAADFIHLALYHPDSGYYMAGKTVVGREGDFITAPEISPLFAQAIAQIIRPSLIALDGVLVEFGAGSGSLAEVLLKALDGIIKDYLIVEVSPALIQRQQLRLQPLLEQTSVNVRWLTDIAELPEAAVLLSNEVLDAIPCHPFRYTPQGFQEQVIRWGDEGFVRDWSPTLSQALRDWLERHRDKYEWQTGQLYEAAPWRSQWLETIAEQMQQAAWILIDYGYNAAEFFHQQRQQGSLCCFYRHRQHQQWTYLTGLQDISSHVNFSELCFAAENRGLQLSGFTSQAQMILDSGILQQLTLSDDLAERVQLSQQLQQLMMPGAMGELVKVIAFTQGISENAAPRVSSERLTRL